MLSFASNTNWIIIYMKKILVLCTGNSCRSQIAEGYLQHFAGDKAEIYSAGIETHGVNSESNRNNERRWY